MRPGGGGVDETGGEGVKAPCQRRTGPRVTSLFLLACVLLTFSCAVSPSTPSGPGVYHLAKGGDSVAAVARMYGVDPRAVARANNLSVNTVLKEERALFIPGGRPLKTSAPPGEKVLGEAPGRKGTDHPASQSAKGGETAAHRPPGTLVPPAGAKGSEKQGRDEGAKEPPSPLKKRDDGPPVTAKKGLFAWPLQGKVTSTFGVQPGGLIHNHIRIEAPEGSPVRAAADGVVIFSSFLKEFGETVIIKHVQEYATVYTHLVERRVKVGQRVRRGEAIAHAARGEKKGESYLHFEIRHRNRAVNPLSFLP